MVMYKIDTGSDSNNMPSHVYTKIFPYIIKEQLIKARNKRITLKTYNKTSITQLGTCKVTIEHNNNTKRCHFFLVLGNGQALLGMPDTDALQICNINIDSIGAEDARNTKNNINTDATQESNANQDRYIAVKCCANTTSISKSTNNRNRSTANTNTNTPAKYFLLCPKYETDKRKSAELTQQIHKEFDNVFNGIGCFEGTFSLQLKPDSRPYQAPK